VSKYVSSGRTLVSTQREAVRTTQQPAYRNAFRATVKFPVVAAFNDTFRTTVCSAHLGFHLGAIFNSFDEAS
jgi:PPE-repeat protein